MTVRDLYIYSRDGHTFILYKEGATKSCFKGSLEDCPTELIDKLVYQLGYPPTTFFDNLLSHFSVVKL